MKFEPENNGGCQINGCSDRILEAAHFPLCASHFYQKRSVDNNHCLIKLCENERHEAFSFCEKHCDEFFEKEETELKQKIEQLEKDLVDARKANSELYMENVGLKLNCDLLRTTSKDLKRHIAGLKEISKKHLEKPLLTDVINSKGLILCSVETMKKILNDG